LICGCALSFATAAPASAQALPGWDNVLSFTKVRIGENHWQLTGAVELESKESNTKIYADKVEILTDENRVIGSGNVVIRQGTNQIAADEADFNMQTHLGTFHNATGFETLQPVRQAARPGLSVPQQTGAPTSVYFFGETIEKVGVKKYKITNGGFTTCVQPTPRWDLHADTVILNIDHYTVLRQAILTVKGVPMLYLPVMYYPTKRDDRVTGFLLPTYGVSTLRGQSIHNAFFWALDRSQDATFLYDWFSKTGQGVGSEYRYNFGGGSDGTIRAYLLNNHDASYTQSDGTTTLVSGSRSYEVQGAASQMLPLNLRARGSVSYFSSIATNQTFNTNIYDASRNQRTFGGNLIGNWGTYTFNGTFAYNEFFYDTTGTNTSTNGSWPRFALTRNERPLLDTPLYFSVGTEYARILRDDRNGDTEVNQTLSRMDFTPQIRFPFKKWQWFTVNSTLAWRDTFYTRSLDPLAGTIEDSSVNRRFFTAQAQLLGPVFNRIWDTPNNGYAEKFKHSIEPFLNITRTSAIDNYSQIVKLEGIDYTVGGVTQYNYGVINRFYAKRRLSPGAPAMSREIFNVQIQQTYYTDQLAAQVDPRYATSFTGAAPSNFSPIAVTARAMPTTDFNATVNAEFDSRYHQLRTVSANGTYSWTSRFQLTGGWSKKAFIEQLSGFNDPTQLDQYVTASTTVHTIDNHVGGIYSFNYDVLHGIMQSQRMSYFYNAQCCGIAFEFQTYNFGASSASPVPSDHRFFLSFTLAGLGNFSPFNGALSGVPR
jgi:LPS-assembly protein